MAVAPTSSAHPYSPTLFPGLRLPIPCRRPAPPMESFRIAPVQTPAISEKSLPSIRPSNVDDDTAQMLRNDLRSDRIYRGYPTLDFIERVWGAKPQNIPAGRYEINGQLSSLLTTTSTSEQPLEYDSQSIFISIFKSLMEQIASKLNIHESCILTNRRDEWETLGLFSTFASTSSLAFASMPPKEVHIAEVCSRHSLYFLKATDSQCSASSREKHSWTNKGIPPIYG